MESLKILARCVAAAILYGIAHDQVTARICVEYFTIGHPRVIASESPTLLALVWGVLATWWVGLGLGLPLAFAARRLARPPRDARSLVRPIGVLLVVMGALALLAGVLGSVLAERGSLLLFEPLASRVPAGRHIPFLAVGAAHSASYAAGFVGGLVLIVRVSRSRGARPTIARQP